jgi:penicillin amidase
MYFDLQDASNQRELAMWELRQALPAPLYALLDRDGTLWDAPLVGAARGEVSLPGPGTLDLRQLPVPAHPHALAAILPPTRVIGSNNFAVSGALTRDARAIVADDMHLQLRVPNIWFRARLRYPDRRAPGGRVDVSGFTLPGLPMVIVGSNGHVAWGFTNSYADVADWAVVAPCPRPAGQTCTPVTHHRERIDVAGAAPVDLDISETAWGPVLAKDPRGNALALRWVGQRPGAVNLGLLQLATTRDVGTALTALRTTAIPAQNVLLADTGGNIAWHIAGPLPRRIGKCQSTAPRPVLVTPTCPPWAVGESGVTRQSPAYTRLWTANNRTLDGSELARIGGSEYALGARAQQIRDDLLAQPQWDERDLLAVQLDDRAVFLKRWWTLLRDDAARARTPALRALSDAAATWQGHASTGSTSYRIVRAWRLAVHARLLDGLTAPAQATLGDNFILPNLPQFEGVAWALASQRPANLLPRRFASWDALFEDAAQQVRDQLTAHGPLAQRTWGERNTANICHPLAAAVPGFVRPLLCMPPDQLRGDSNMPRVTAPDFGASERMVVSPGHEADGIIHMPGGQSDNPLSPFWGAGHAAWVHGAPTAFLPGEPLHTLRLLPAQ